MMKKINLFSLFVSLMCFSFVGNAQNNGFVKLENKEVRGALMSRANFPEKYTLFQADFQEMNQLLLNAPDEFDINANTFTVNLPNASGDVTPYVIFKSPVMASELADKYPGIYSYKGYDQRNPTNIIRMSVSYVHGIHIMGRTGMGETFYVDTYTQDLNAYILYKRNDIQNSNQFFECGTEAENHAYDVMNETTSMVNQTGVFRNYRLAMACTIEYAAYHVNNAPAGVPTSTTVQKKAVVLSAMNTTINRVNMIYENDLSVRMTLVANNDQLIFIDSDNFSNENAGALIYQSQSVIDQVIGNYNYDIGHTVSTGGGGLAGLGVVCNSGSKANGITGSDNPVGDPYDVDYVAHEMGHQFGANHTFNGTGGSCNGNMSNVSAEPGSGTTIMAYAGICSPQNVQNNSDPYFHYYSIQEITNLLNNGTTSSCATSIGNSNVYPVVNPSNPVYIPKNTPFFLHADASDANNANTLTYCWEQLDTQLVNYPLQSSYSSGPAFRSMPPTQNSKRFFPQRSVVFQGVSSYSNAPSSTWEVLPSVQRAMSFGVTVRDNNPNGGGLATRATKGVFVKNVAPFYLTYPNNVISSPAVQWNAGESRIITWNVGGTTGNGINTTNVNIYYTIDGMDTLISLVDNTPNDGSESITVPNVNSSNVRIVIIPTNSSYYAVSKPLTIVPAASIEQFDFEQFSLYPNPTNDVITVSFVLDSPSKVRFELFDLNGRLIVQQEAQAQQEVRESISLQALATGTYLLKITNGQQSATKKVMKK